MKKNAYNKIPLPWASKPDDTLEQATEQFWKMSQAWNGIGKNITVMDALKHCSDILSVVNPERPLAIQARYLKGDIIEHGVKRKKPNNTNVQEAKAYLL